MKAAIMTFPSPHYIHHDGIQIATYAAGPEDGPDYKGPILLVHGWPELAYSWKNIIGPLAEAGYRVIAYDLRGFGNSSAPDDGPSRGAHHYGIAQQVGDLEAVMDAYGLSKAVICGHDWGGIIVWHAARMIASRVSGVISICTPHVGEAPADPIAIFKKRHGDEHYFVHFTERPGAADEPPAPPEMIALDADRKAKLVNFVEASRMPDEAKQRILSQLDAEEVPAETVNRIESRMGG